MRYVFHCFWYMSRPWRRPTEKTCFTNFGKGGRCWADRKKAQSQITRTIRQKTSKNRSNLDHLRYLLSSRGRLWEMLGAKGIRVDPRDHLLTIVDGFWCPLGMTLGHFFTKNCAKCISRRSLGHVLQKTSNFVRKWVQLELCRRGGTCNPLTPVHVS